MKKLIRTRTASLLFTLVVFALILAQPPSLSAQKPKPNPPPPAGTATPNPRPADQPSAEMLILMTKGWTVGDAQRQRAAAQLSFELDRMGQIEAERIAQMSSAKSIDYKNLAQATAEIKDRAVKIKYSLPFVVKDKGEKVRREADASQLLSMLPELSRMIKSFIGNPVLHVSSPQDKELRAAAGHDLEGIIKLSETINKIAKTLSKAFVASK